MVCLATCVAAISLGLSAWQPVQRLDDHITVGGEQFEVLPARQAGNRIRAYSTGSGAASELGIATSCFIETGISGQIYSERDGHGRYYTLCYISDSFFETRLSPPIFILMSEIETMQELSAEACPAFGFCHFMLIGYPERRMIDLVNHLHNARYVSSVEVAGLDVHAVRKLEGDRSSIPEILAAAAEFGLSFIR
jgi:hypothetical protein